MKDLVTIILPTFNRAHLITKCIESVLQQTYLNWELIIVDDGSTDNTEEIISKFLNHKNIKYFKILNSGVGNARNYGMIASSGEYITFLDSDDEYFSTKIEKQIEVFKTSNVNNLGVVSCGRKDFRDNKMYFKWKPKHRGEVLKKLLSKERIGAGTPFLMITRNVVFKDGIYFDTEMPAAEDFDFLVQILLKYNFDYADDYLVKVNHHSGDRVHKSDSALIAIEKQFQKYSTILDKDSNVKEAFVLNWADLLFVYGHKDKAKEVFKKIDFFSVKKYLWYFYFKCFSSINSIQSRFFLKLLRMLK